MRGTLPEARIEIEKEEQKTLAELERR